MFCLLKKYLRRKIWAIVVLNILQNTRNAILGFWGRGKVVVISVDCRDRDAVENARYAMHMVQEYEKALGGSWNLRDATIVELGPGPFKAVALILIGKGAKKVIGFDKYGFAVDSVYERQLYQAVVDLVPPEEKINIRKVLDDNGGFKKRWEQFIDFRYGARLGEVLVDCRGEVDWILSRSVLEYMDDLPGVMRSCAEMLKPDGRMIHKVDLRDDGMFSEAGLHPLTFLTIPGNIYRMMISHTYRPRRWRVEDYMKAFEMSGFFVEFLVTRLMSDSRDRDDWIAVSDVNVPCDLDLRNIKSRIALPFRSSTCERLVVAGGFVTAAI
ncbi:MAG: methyltransferase domain-containing protein [Kiritimatiellae bacterium]|nr:methyltransferase domain-containing protein [Kiritimatiellia bacterium]